MKPRLLFLASIFLLLSPSPVLSLEQNPNPLGGQTCTQNLHQEISQFFNQGASGYLLWQYSGNRTLNPLENDQYSFFKDSDVCAALNSLKGQFPGKFIGVNIHSLAKHDDGAINEHLAYLASSCGTSVVRIWGSPDRASAQKLKTTLNIAANHGIKVIIVLADYSNSSGQILPSSIHSNPTSWYQSDYKTYYLPHVRQVVSTIGNHPALFGYELANEPHCDGQPACPPAYNQWAAQVSAAIKAINPSAQVGIGQMASQSTTLGDTPQNNNYYNSNNTDSITMASAHYYTDSEKTSALSALSQAKSLGKLFYIGEAPSTCIETPDCNLESIAFPPVHIQKADPSHPGEAQNPFAPHPNNYPPGQEFVTICQDSAEISQTFNEHKDENNQTVPYTATQLQKEIDQNEYSNSLAKKLSVYFKRITNPFAPKTQIQDSFKSFDNNYIAASYRMTTTAQQDTFKQNLITQAKNGQVLDEQIAWSCPNGCFTLNCGKPSSDCTPVYLSQDSHTCHQKAYQYLQLTTSGSLNSRLIIHNDNGDQTADRMLPYAAVHTNTNVPQLGLSTNQQKSSTQICRTVPKSPTTSTTNPVKFNLFKFISELIDKTKIISKPVSYDELHDPRLKTGLDTQKTFFSNFLPSKNTQKINHKPDSSTTGKINLKDPGGGAPEDVFDTFSQYLHPARGYKPTPNL